VGVAVAEGMGRDPAPHGTASVARSRVSSARACLAELALAPQQSQGLAASGRLARRGGTVPINGPDRHGADGHHARPAALAGHTEDAGVEVDVLAAQARGPRPAGRPVSMRTRRIASSPAARVGPGRARRRRGLARRSASRRTGGGASGSRGGRMCTTALANLALFDAPHEERLDAPEAVVGSPGRPGRARRSVTERLDVLPADGPPRRSAPGRGEEAGEWSTLVA